MKFVREPLVHFFLLGAAMFGYALHAWAQVEFGPLPSPAIPRMVLAGMTLIVMGAQVLFTGFLLGILEIPMQGKSTIPPEPSM